ncbi:uncharacterized protein [Physcomitrium patens]|uniref:Uncharacterized protein n=1 Tax=Physcomitrium patens TaxID=3218 RepID=A9RHQ5_PHYPA|nr:uncharacterized protein LOC112275745 isoform X2 [Physcomitrium patens]PNR29060.1 hypothetical protein PHYPA_027752 [Physcomitrium patens]|eukprot:XP_024362131.1 uncharacterized protein LOC112275745 isoform X2 [Physcomitrella patens]
MAPCLCAPTSHEGSFRCRLHREVIRSVIGASNRGSWSTVRQASAAVPCLCAPTSHPGSFRCRLHRTKEPSWGGRPLLPSAHAKALRSSELPPSKPSDTISVKKTAFARTNRSTISESKLRSELNKAMPEIVAAVDKLRITPVEILTKKGKLIVAPVPGTATVRAASNSIISQENALLSDAVAAKATKEILMRSQNKGVKKPPTCKERRLRAKSDVLATILT